jgi:hypothetical protein
MIKLERSRHHFAQQQSPVLVLPKYPYQSYVVRLPWQLPQHGAGSFGKIPLSVG